MNEIWKDVKGYEGLYQVSNLGRVKSFYTNRILKPGTDKDGYLRVDLCKDKKPKHFHIHRLVAETFLPNPENKPCVNHKLGKKQDNRATELEWCTYSENEIHSFNVLGKKANGLTSMKGKFGFDHNRSKPVICLNNGKIYGSASEAGRELNIIQTGVSSVCRGKLNHYKGYKFKFAS